jgi:hypothetical protein
MAPVLAAIGSVGSVLAANAGTIGTALQVAGAVAGAGGSIYSGIKQEEFAKTQAKAMRDKGDQEFAIAQRRAMESRRQKRQALGRAQVVAASSGAGTGDTVTDIMTGIEQRGEYNALTDMFNGQVARNDLYRDAKMTVQGGRDAKVAGFIGAGTGLLNSAGTIYSDYSDRAAASRNQAKRMGY